MFTMKEYYRDFYGCTASIKHNRDGALLTVRTPAGKVIEYKRYKTRHGARIAMGKMSDCWTFVKQESTGKIKLKL